MFADQAERIDDDRKERQALYPEIEITDMYNVVEKLRSGDALGRRGSFTSRV